MNCLRKPILFSCAAILICSLLASSSAYARLGGKSKKAPAPVRRSVVIFPFDEAQSLSVPETFGSDMAGAIRNCLSGSPRFLAVLFSENLSSIRRAKEDNTVKNADIAGPYADDKTKASKLARLLACDLYVTGTIETLEVDTAKSAGQVTVSGELTDTKTGKVLKSWLVTGTVPATSQSADGDELRALAAGDAISKIREQILAWQAPAAPAPALCK